MAEYLGQHPDVFMPENKDSTTFGSDLDFRHNVNHPPDKFRVAREVFLSWYERAETEKRLGEASVAYLFSRRAAAELHELNPQSQVIVMLRNPVDMIYSLHSHFLFDLNEDIEDFEEAINAEDDRRQGRRVPPTAFVPSMLVYHDVAKYTEQLERYWQVFGRDRVHVIIFDDFREDTAQVYHKTLEFLGVDPSFEADLRVVNAAKRLRSRALADFLVNPPWPLRPVAERLSRVGWLRKAVNSALVRFNTVQQRRELMDPELRDRLNRDFQPEVEQLSEMLGRDLTHWTRVPTPAVAAHDSGGRKAGREGV